MTRRQSRLVRRIIQLALLAWGGYMVLSSLWGMCQTAVYLHETITVTGKVKDFRQRPFEGIREALRSGNLSTGGDTAYFPIVSFSFDNGAHISRFALSAPDNATPQIDADIELRTYPYDPSAPDKTPWRPEGVQPARASYLWGGDALGLLFGLTIGGIAYLMLRSRRPQPATKQAPKPQRKQAPAPAKKATSVPAPSVANEEPFTLSAEPEQPKKKRTRKPADPNAPKKPRAPRKKKETAPTAPPKPRKPRKKKQTVETE